MKPPMKSGSPDAFQTPEIAVKPLFQYLKKDWLIWEPACGKGNIVRALSSAGYATIGTDVLTGHDFLSYSPKVFDCIITNPPFSLKDEFLSHAYALGKPFAFLLPLTTFEGKERQVLFRKYGIQIILFDKRLNFTTPNGKGSSSWFMTAWFTHGLNLPAQINFVELKYAHDRYQEKLKHDDVTCATAL